MIKINLLPVKADKKGSPLRVQAAVAAACLLAELGICFYFYRGLNQTITQRRQELTAKQEEIKRLQTIIGEVDKIKDTKAQLQKKLDVIDALERGRLDTVRVMEVVARAIPDAVWLESFDLKGTGVQLSGMAVDNQVIAIFIQNLNRNPQVANVILSETSRTKRDGIDFVKFSLTFSVQPKPAGPKQG